MRRAHKPKKRQSETGAALLIAIFALLLISVIAIALLVSSGTDSALASNYRTSTGAYYAGLAGLEEARGRILWRNPDYVNNTLAGYFPSPSTPGMGLSQVLYILNPASGETVAPTDLGNPNTYPDNEYQQEFGIPVTAATVQTINSVSGAGGVPGPLFKWVRVTPATEKSLGLDVDADGQLNDSTSVLYYDPMHFIINGTIKPGLVTSNASPSARQALEITALAVIPPNTQKLLQYVVVPSSLNLNFSSALTLAGNNVNYAGPNSNLFFVNGDDPTLNRTCATPPLPPVPAIGYTNLADNSNTNIQTGTTAQPGNYVGSTPSPSVGVVSLPPNLQKPSTLDALAQTITQSADVKLPGPNLPNNNMGSATNPLTVVVQGDLDLTSWHHTGYGLLLVTGNLNYDPDASWYGIVLVIGKGTFTGSHNGSGRIEGAVFVAQTRDPSNNWSLLPDPDLGAASVTFDPAMGGAGIYFDSCWIASAQPPFTFRVLSFRELPSAN